MKSKALKRALLISTALLLALLTSYGQENNSGQLVGTWTKVSNERSVTFTLTVDKKYQVEFVGDEKIDVFGSYAISGTTITFNDEGGAYSADEPGVYEFEVNETSIKFKKSDDPVYGRSILVEGTWTKKE